MMLNPSILVNLSPVQPSLPNAQGSPGADLAGLVALVILIVIAVASQAALTVLVAALLPRPVNRSHAAILRAPRRAFFIGLANYLLLGAVSLLLLSTGIPPLGVIALVIIAAVLVITFFGLVGLTRLLGERLSTLAGREFSGLKQLLWGAVCLELALLLPGLGWFVLTPILLMVSFGATVLGWLSRPSVENAEAAG